MVAGCVFFKICVDRNGLFGFFCLIVAQYFRFYSGLIESRSGRVRRPAIVQKERVRGKRMTIEACKKCKYHVDLVSGQVMCKYKYNIDSIATSGTQVVGCPLDRQK